MWWTGRKAKLFLGVVLVSVGNALGGVIGWHEAVVAIIGALFVWLGALGVQDAGTGGKTK